MGGAVARIALLSSFCCEVLCAGWRRGHAQPAELVLGRPISIEDPSGRALRHFHRALRRAERGRGRARILVYGASHTASDTFTGYLRTSLQERFGDAGQGFVMPVRPFGAYHHSDVRIEQGGEWRTIRVRGRHRRRDAYGLAGVAVEARSEAWAKLEPLHTSGRGSQVQRFELFYLRQPRGGRIDILVDGRRRRRLSTRARRRSAGYVRITVRDGFHRFEIRTRGRGRVRLFGAVMERRAPGVIVDALGIPGSRARDQLPWNEKVRRAYLRRRKPNLVVLAYGTNESGYANLRLRDYERELRRVLQRVKRGARRASCLLIGPSEWPVEQADGTWTPRRSTARIIAAQRRVAARFRCGFFDLVAFQGGAGSMTEWVAHDYAGEDHVHYTDRGYRRLAEVLEHALLEGYER